MNQQIKPKQNRDEIMMGRKTTAWAECIESFPENFFIQGKMRNNHPK